MKQLDLFPAPQPKPRKREPQEWKVVSLRECPTPEQMQQCETPEQAVAYWRSHIASDPRFNPECECLVVLILNTRRRIRGHHVVSIGTMDQVMAHPRDVFRIAVTSGASAIICMHNHPSGDSSPSGPDISTTRDLIRAGELLKIELLDHIIIGHPSFTSIKGLGYFSG